MRHTFVKREKKKEGTRRVPSFLCPSPHPPRLAAPPASSRRPAPPRPARLVSPRCPVLPRPAPATPPAPTLAAAGDKILHGFYKTDTLDLTLTCYDGIGQECVKYENE